MREKNCVIHMHPFLLMIKTLWKMLLYIYKNHP